MYAVSWDNDSYLVLREKKSRKEAEESLNYETLNLIYENCFNKKPNSAVLKNRELKQFVEENTKLIANLKKLMPDIKDERVKTGLYPLIVFLPSIVKQYISVQRELDRSKIGYSIREVVELAKARVAASS